MSQYLPHLVRGSAGERRGTKTLGATNCAHQGLHSSSNGRCWSGTGANNVTSPQDARARNVLNARLPEPEKRGEGGTGDMSKIFIECQ